MSTIEHVNTLHRLFLRIHKAQSAFLQPERESLGLGPGQPRVLNSLLAKGECTQSEIANDLKSDPASVSRMVEALKAAGFITRRADEDCRRANRIALTEKGEAAARKWKECTEALEARLTVGFSDEERALLSLLLERVLANLEESER